MPRIPIHRLRKKDMIVLNKFTCKHGHSGLTHYNCWLKEAKAKERVGYFDIEASNLKANFGIMFGYCIKDRGKKKIYQSTVTKEGLNKHLDRDVIKQCVADLKKFDRVVTYYGTGFDLPFVRTRAAYWEIPFPEIDEIRHTDLYYLIRNKFCLHSNRLENACKVILGRSAKTHLDPNHWIRALQGNKKSLDYIQDHCVKDVQDLEKLHNKTFMYRKIADNSI